MKNLVKLYDKAKLLIFVLCLPQLYFSQDGRLEVSVNTLTSNEVYTVYQDSLVVITLKKVNYLNEQDGINHERISYSFLNLTDKLHSVTFKRSLVYENSISLTGDSNEVNLVLNPFERLDMDSNPRNKVLYSFSKDHKNTIKKQLQSVVISNITIL
jgi:hypothetical protein